MSKTFKVFVYGTLKKGHHAFHGSYLIGEVKPSKVMGMRMLHIGGFPGAVEGEEDDVIMGEIHEYPEELLASLDAYEGTPTLFSRILVKAGEEEVYMYRFNKASHENYDVVPSGIWN